MKQEEKDQTGAKRVKGEWVRPHLKRVGNIGEVLQGGGGKLSPITNDPGDNRKPSGSG